MRNIVILLSSLLILTGCVTSTVETQNAASLSNTDFTGVSKVVLVPIKVEVKESGIGSLEKLPERSELATRIVHDELRAAFSKNGQIEVVEYTPINSEQVAQLDEYVGLYQRVAGAAESIQYMGPAWKNRSDFDYTLGDGLAYLRDATGADKAIFVYGEDIVSSSGKKAMAIAAMFVGVGVNPGGVAVLHVGLVDLNNGHLLWSNSSASQGLSLDDNESVQKALVDILKTNPILNK
jgi:hypothetical protein